MSQQLLVPIKRGDQIKEVLPYLEEIARPDMRVVFLVHFGINRFAELSGRLLEIQSGLPGNLLSDSAAPQSHVTHRIEHASQELRDRGVRIEVKFYSGRLQSIMRQCIENYADLTVIMRPTKNLAQRWVQRLFFAARRTAASSEMPVILCHPSSLTRR